MTVWLSWLAHARMLACRVNASERLGDPMTYGNI